MEFMVAINAIWSNIELLKNVQKYVTILFL